MTVLDAIRGSENQRGVVRSIAALSLAFALVSCAGSSSRTDAGSQPPDSAADKPTSDARADRSARDVATKSDDARSDAPVDRASADRPRPEDARASDTHPTGDAARDGARDVVRDSASPPFDGSTFDAGAQSCVPVRCDWDLVGLGNGTLWSGGKTQLTYAGGAPIVAKTFSAVTFSPPSSQACAVRGDGAVFCWGDNGLGQLGAGQLASGDAGVPSTQTPQRVLTGSSGPALGGIVSVAVSNNGACAIDGAGGVWCWGDGQAGQLGNGTLAPSPFAVRVMNASGGTPLSGAVALAVGTMHACVVKSGGTVWCWGQEVGTASAITDTYPLQISGIAEPANSVGAADNQSCVSTTGGHVWCWGANVLGNGTTGTRSATPVQVLTAAATPLANALEVVVWAPDRGACSLQSDASIWCWSGSYAGNSTSSLAGRPVSVTSMGRYCFIDSLGEFWYGSSFQSSPTCP